ncbi:hypothetical protein L1887_02841 [Cichorium endivia]|nr:hypothetical protein L1887_02841 [Cichorium endivia]
MDIIKGDFECVKGFGFRWIQCWILISDGTRFSKRMWDCNSRSKTQFNKEGITVKKKFNLYLDRFGIHNIRAQYYKEKKHQRECKVETGDEHQVGQSNDNLALDLTQL